MRRILATPTIAFAATLILATAALAADPDPALPGKMSEKIVGELAKNDLDGLSADATKYMGEKTGAEIKTSFASIKNLGTSNYSDLIYARDYGKAEKDIIYKIDFPSALLYVRLVWHVHNGDWRLMHLTYKADENLPFPTGWEHIYPK